ncbi:MAG TPA: alpha/beta hydrolase [Actinobacteria bacterium]|nr:alpha/beta hydrolase [Actinomycetota bacterium]
MTEALVVDLGTPVHVVDHGGAGPLTLLLHGLGGSAATWITVADRLAATGRRVLAPDLAGFGITPPGDRGSGVEANAALVADLVARFGEPAVLVGNSMGGLVALLAATRHPAAVAALVLVAPALPPTPRHLDPEVTVKLLGPLLPGLGAPAIRAYRATHDPELETAETLAMCTARPEAIPEEARAALVEVNRLRRSLDWTVPAFVEADRSIARWVLDRRRYRRLLHAVTQPTRVVCGAEDRLVPVASARWAAGERPDWDLVVLDDVGHLPMLETPDRFVELVATWPPDRRAR